MKVVISNPGRHFLTLDRVFLCVDIGSRVSTGSDSDQETVKKSQGAYISPPPEAATTGLIKTKLGGVVATLNITTYTQNLK